MTPEQYERIREVFLAAREKDPHQRAQFLDRACAGDDRLRADVEHLLASDNEADTFLQTPALGEDFAKAHPDSLLPKAASAGEDGRSAGIRIDRTRPGPRPDYIGQYRILDTLGEGGMGVVYRAEQESPRRTVALKVIKAGAESPGLLKRFEHEGQVLGWLQHPGIAQIFEAGTADTGQGVQPFFAMEFVRGQALTGYIAARKLGLRQRLELIAKVCDAVHHAHQKGVIHRDLKPANILVDDSGQPKVLDFGVARVTDADIRTTTLQTDVGQLVGTIAYMSPEQVAGDSRELDTRSDIYALGVILYELLAGRVPFDVSRQTIPQAARMITEEEPTSLSFINRVFRGDIETIVAKALEKDKNRRYQSAAALAADIRRYLLDEPISARPASAVYQLRKFARRNAALVAGVLATFVVLLIGVAGTSYGLMQATAQRRDAESERNRALAAERVAEQRREEAERQATIAQAVIDFLNEDLLAAVDPRHTANREITMKEVLDAASEKIEGAFEDEPAVEAAIRTTLGATYGELGEYESAELHLELALELRRDTLGEEDLDTLRSMDMLGVTYQKQGRYEKAEPLLTRALKISRRVFGEEDAHTATCMNDLGVLYQAQGRFGEAEPLLVEALEISRRVLGGEHPETLTRMNNLALSYGRQGRYTEAEPLLVQTLEIRRRVLREDHPDTLVSINNLAALYGRQGRNAEAEKLFFEAMEIGQRVLGEDHPSTLMAVNNLALSYKKQGRYAEAEPLLVRTLRACQRTLGAEHPRTLTAMNSLALVYERQRRYDKAEPLLVDALETCQRVLGEEHPRTLTAMNNLALVYQRQGRYGDAEPLFVDALQTGQRVLGEEHPSTLTWMNNTAHLYHDQGRYDDAEPLYAKALEIRRRVLGSEHPKTSISMKNLAALYVDQRRYAEAEPLLRECLGLRRAALPGDDRFIAITQSLLGDCLTALGRYADAEPLLLDSYEQVRANPDAPAEQLRQVLERIVGLYHAWGKPGRAAEWRAKSKAESDPARAEVMHEAKAP